MCANGPVEGCSAMKTFMLCVQLQVEVEAPDLNDAKAIVEDLFGEGDFGGDVSVVDFEITDCEAFDESD